jgi:hypothetical protein
MFIKFIFSSNVYSSICKCELLEKEFEYTTEVIRIRKEEEQTTQWPKEKVQKDKKSLKIPKG